MPRRAPPPTPPPANCAGRGENSPALRQPWTRDVEAPNERASGPCRGLTTPTTGRATQPGSHENKPIHEGGFRVFVAANSFARPTGRARNSASLPRKDRAQLEGAGDGRRRLVVEHHHPLVVLSQLSHHEQHRSLGLHGTPFHVAPGTRRAKIGPDPHPCQPPEGGAGAGPANAPASRPDVVHGHLISTCGSRPPRSPGSPRRPRESTWASWSRSPAAGECGCPPRGRTS